MNTSITSAESASLQARKVWCRIGLVLLAFVSLAPRLAAQEKSFLWKVQSKQGAIYVLGSIHYLKRENYPLRKSIQDAFENCRTLVFEIDLSSAPPERAQQLMLEKARYRDGTLLQQHITSQTYKLAERRAQELGIDISQMSPFKPWFVALSLLSLKLQKMGFDPNYGLDRFLADQAKRGDKIIRGLESLEFQFGLLDQLSSSEQDSMLRQTLDELDLLDKSLDQLVESWLTGNARAVEDLLLASMKEYPAVYRKVVIDRNRRWLPDLIKMLEQGEKALVVVGAAHLVGQDGLIELLKQRGYTVEQL
ncbi:MAG: TraB/GumN family protein [Deltaproteobacteria bacterium]